MTEPTPGGQDARRPDDDGHPRPPVRSPLIWFSGADTEVLAMTPGDRARYTGMGSAVLFTASLGGLSMCLAMRMALGLPIAICLLIAVGWFFGIAGLDRWLVSSMDKPARDRDGEVASWDAPAESRSPYKLALPRLGLALLFGMVISTPLTLQIFDTEIRAEINKIHQDEWNDYVKEMRSGSSGRRIADLTTRQAQLQEVVNSGGRSGDPAVTNPDVAAYDKKLEGMRQQLTELDQKRACEQEGVNSGTDCRGTSGREGCGARCDAFERARNRLSGEIKKVEQQRAALVQRLRSQESSGAESRLAQAKAQLEEVNGELGRLQQAQAKLLNQGKADNEANDGLLIRMEALEKASTGSLTLGLARLVLFLFFTAIECLPVIVKLLMNDGAYENLARERRRQDEIRGRRELLSRRRVDAQHYEDEVYYGERLRAARWAAIDDLVTETTALETDVARRRLYWWYSQQSRDLPPAPPNEVPQQFGQDPEPPESWPDETPPDPSGHSPNDIHIPPQPGPSEPEPEPEQQPPYQRSPYQQPSPPPLPPRGGTGNGRPDPYGSRGRRSRGRAEGEQADRLQPMEATSHYTGPHDVPVGDMEAGWIRSRVVHIRERLLWLYQRSERKG
ncbi:uncharacterized protein DUF4407 [Actinomadura pelletieri DSM 43383]|uniref:Uncharacterized protein DUF4407 n=1 Tax=Actinomadura pelletieri DSM 43383 TaxID=1120940 RepID=A0A495QZI9_9ACTN|nr:DUF4407 domain-containing protein [Actinomadura pelletieri]RKS79635.1 uncharacterized protein DUF4407 [Actinomadura pelletieri DSM 43383]